MVATHGTTSYLFQNNLSILTRLEKDTGQYRTIDYLLKDFYSMLKFTWIKFLHKGIHLYMVLILYTFECIAQKNLY